MCSKARSFEKRNVKVGVSDYFYAEIQEGLTPARSCPSSCPRRRAKRRAKQVAVQKKCGGVPGAAEPFDRGQRHQRNQDCQRGTPPPGQCQCRQRRRPGRGRQIVTCLRAPAFVSTSIFAPWPWSNSATSARSTASARRKSAPWMTSRWTSRRASSSRSSAPRAAASPP